MISPDFDNNFTIIDQLFALLDGVEITCHPNCATENKGVVISDNDLMEFAERLHGGSNEGIQNDT